MTECPLQEAKSKFSAVVEAAVAGEPQRVTKRGKPAVVVLGVDQHERLRRLEKATVSAFTDVLFAIPQDDEKFERLRRPVDSDVPDRYRRSAGAAKTEAPPRDRDPVHAHALAAWLGSSRSAASGFSLSTCWRAPVGRACPACLGTEAAIC